MADKDNLCQGGAAVLIGSDLGYLGDGITFAPTLSQYYQKVEGIPMDIGARDTWGYDISFVLSEITQANMKIAMGIQETIAAGPPATLDIVPEAVPTEQVIVIYSDVPGGDLFLRTITGDRCVLSAPAALVTKDAEESKLACTFHLLYDFTNGWAAQISDAAA